MADALACVEAGFRDALLELLDATPELEALLNSCSIEQLERHGREGARQALAPLVWRAVAGEAMTTEQLRQMLDVTRQALHKRVENGTLLGLPGVRTTLFPSWQFSGAVVRPIVGDILREFRGRLGEEFDPRLVASWATTRQPELKDSSPAAWVSDDLDPEPVVLAAKRAAEALTR